MNAIRQYKDVVNNSFSVELPENFNVKRVEIIIIPDEENVEISDSTKLMLDERIAHYEKFGDEYEDFEIVMKELESDL